MYTYSFSCGNHASFFSRIFARRQQVNVFVPFSTRGNETYENSVIMDNCFIKTTTVIGNTERADSQCTAWRVRDEGVPRAQPAVLIFLLDVHCRYDVRVLYVFLFFFFLLSLQPSRTPTSLRVITVKITVGRASEWLTWRFRRHVEIDSDLDRFCERIVNKKTFFHPKHKKYLLCFFFRRGSYSMFNGFGSAKWRMLHVTIIFPLCRNETAGFDRDFLYEQRQRYVEINFLI